MLHAKGKAELRIRRHHCSWLSIGSLSSNQFQQLHLIDHLEHTGCQCFHHKLATAGDINKCGHCHCCTKLSPVRSGRGRGRDLTAVITLLQIHSARPVSGYHATNVRLLFSTYAVCACALVMNVAAAGCACSGCSVVESTRQKDSSRRQNDPITISKHWHKLPKVLLLFRQSMSTGHWCSTAHVYSSTSHVIYLVSNVLYS